MSAAQRRRLEALGADSAGAAPAFWLLCALHARLRAFSIVRPAGGSAGPPGLARSVRQPTLCLCHACRVGDQLRFGESSRTYVLCGPADLMPEEGPSREDRMKQAALKVGRSLPRARPCSDALASCLPSLAHAATGVLALEWRSICGQGVAGRRLRQRACGPSLL